MSRFQYPVACWIVFLFAGFVQADGLVYQLPKDGTWVSYDFTVSAKAQGQDMKAEGTLWMASVGQTTQDNQPCRWIELQLNLTSDLGGQKRTKVELYKVLVPEKYLAKGESPMEHVLQAWAKRSHMELKKLDDPGDVDRSPLPIILAGPWKDAKQLEKVEVESKLGKLACEGVESSNEFKLRNEGVMKVKQEVRLHPDAPFGIVSSRWLVDAPRSQNMEWTLKFTDKGDKAESKLPDVK
jgi:hypothetical protein